MIAAAATAVDIGASLLLDKPDLGAAARIAIAISPLPGCILLAIMVFKGVRALDEFQKRVQFEAIVISFLSTAIAVFVYGYLERAHLAGPLNMAAVGVCMVFFYAIGYIVALSHYK